MNPHILASISTTINHLTANTLKFTENKKIAHGIVSIIIFLKTVLVGTGFSTTDSKVTGDPVKNISLTADQNPKHVDSSSKTLKAILQGSAQNALDTHTLTTTQHTFERFLMIETDLDELNHELGIPASFDRLYIEITPANQGDFISGIGTLTSAITTLTINIHMDKEADSAEGYRQYIEDAIPINTEHANKKITRVLQSNRSIDSILICEPPVEIKGMRILRNTNEVIYEATYDIVKQWTNRVKNLAGNYAWIDPVEFIDTGNDCVLELELGSVSGASSIPILAEYLYKIPTPAVSVGKV